jgi:hypothetical protein
LAATPPGGAGGFGGNSTANGGNVNPTITFNPNITSTGTGTGGAGGFGGSVGDTTAEAASAQAARTVRSP